MKIGIDARLYGTQHGGIGRYTEELIKNLEKIDNNNDYEIFLNRDGFLLYEPQNPKFKKIKADFRVYGWREQILYPLFLAFRGLDFIHFTHFNVPIFCINKFILTIHDLIISHYPDSRATTLPPIIYRFKLLFYHVLIAQVARRAKKIIAVSQFTKQDIIDLLKIDSEKISVVYEGMSLPPINKDSEQLLNKWDLADNFLLYVGSAYPHKNLERLLDAFLIILKSRPDCQLVLGGKINYFYRRLADYIEKNEALRGLNQAGQPKIIITDYLSDEELSALYQRASVYVFPSLIEGFGLPPLEAQSYGLPVVSSNRSCLPEILADSAVYFDPENIQEMALVVLSVLNDSILREKLITSGDKNWRRYSWFQMANEIQDIYLKINF